MRSFGQNLAEYGLVLGLVSIVSIGALSTLGNSVSGSLSQTIVKRPANAAAPIAPAVAAAPPTLPTTPGSVPIVSAANPLSPSVQPVSPAVQTSETPPSIVPEKTLAMGGALASSMMANPASPKPKPEPLARGAVPEKKLCLSDASCLNIPDVMDNTTVLEATGGLGGQLTHQYAKVLDQVVAQLEKEPKTTQNKTLVQEIKKLATNGHTLGSEIEKYQDTCDKSTSKFCSLKNDGASSFKGKSSSFNTQLKKVQGLLTKAQTPQVIQKIVTQSSAEITGIANGLKINYVTEEKVTDRLDRDNTAKIHFNANTICATSGNSTGCMVPPKSK